MNNRIIGFKIKFVKHHSCCKEPETHWYNGPDFEGHPHKAKLFDIDEYEYYFEALEFDIRQKNIVFVFIEAPDLELLTNC